ncbi:MAG: hypothetical protein ACTSRS_01895 [Candidatus Helarchaeota archaeon]
MKFNKIVNYTIILFLGYGIIQFLPRFVHFSIPIPVALETGTITWFNLPFSTFLDIVASSPFMIYMFYFIQRAITQEAGPQYIKPSEKKRRFIRVLLYGSAIVLVIGIVMHAVANQLNGILGNPVPPSTNFEIAIYWFDEVLGHKLIHFAIYAFFIGCFVLQYWHRREANLTKFGIAGMYFWAAAIGVIYSFAALEGQAGFDLMIFSIVLIGIILYYVRFKGLKLKENIFTYFALIFFVSLTITTIVYAIVFLDQLVAGYPFFPQPTFT